jgi:hypothetical protein
MNIINQSVAQSKPQAKTANKNQWKLLEMIQMGDDLSDSESGALIQWLKFAGTDPEAQGPLVILAGFEGPAKNDSRVLQLLQKALSSGVIDTVSDIYLCPVANPTPNKKAPHLNVRGNDIMNDFPTLKNNAASDLGQSFEVSTLIRWIESVQPKAILTLQANKPYINQYGVAEELIEKLGTLSERPLLNIGEVPAIEEEENPIKIPEEELPTHNFDKNIGQWCTEKEILWLNFSVDSAKKSFDELREDWRLNLGPALKWLLEGPRFNPPIEEPAFATPTVIPTLDLPPELMNL